MTTRRSRAVVGLVASLAAAALIAALAGCAPSTPARLSGVVATGTIRSVTGAPKITGKVTVTAVAKSQSFLVTVHKTSGTTGPLWGINLTSRVIAPSDKCAPGGLTFGAGSMTRKSTVKLVLPGKKYGGAGWENPSFLHDMDITDTSKNPTPSCINSLAAYAPLKWTIGDIRPDISVVDHGKRAGAEGTPVTVKGKPWTYQVVADDNLSSIAQRFGITVQDLFYLNPARSPSPEDPVAYTGETLNLSKANR